jgi:1-acyl-sn-glycerol-3-phosphate acyltransferase
MKLLRSLLFALGYLILTPVFSFLGLLSFPFGYLARYRVISTWTRLLLGWLRLTCDIRFKLIGAEHIPDQPSIVLSKHQSAWETLAFQLIFPPQVWVLKKSLLWIPFFGWGLAMLKPIAIDRTAGREALRQIEKQGKDRLAKGLWVIVFPEGTRMKPGTKGKYGIGGAWLASHTGAPVVPVAHNAGEFWPRNAFIKSPGVITVSIGEPIQSEGMKPGDLNARVEAWIETEMQKIASGAYEKV